MTDAGKTHSFTRDYSEKRVNSWIIDNNEKIYKDSGLVIINECGHLSMMEKSQETATVCMDFLRDKNRPLPLD